MRPFSPAHYRNHPSLYTYQSPDEYLQTKIDEIAPEHPTLSSLELAELAQDILNEAYIDDLTSSAGQTYEDNLTLLDERLAHLI